jgi:hypothetical protein
MVIFMAVVSVCGAAPNSGNGGAGRLQLRGSGGCKGFIAWERDGGAPLHLWDAGRRRQKVGGWFTSIGGDGSGGPSGPDFWMAQMHQTVKSNY